MRYFVLLLVGWVVLFRGVCPCRAADAILDPDEEFLRDSGLATDPKSLMEFLRKQYPAEADPTKTGTLIEQLGAGKFAKRQEASALLMTIGPSALPALEQALNHNDLEVSRRAATCIQEINKAAQSVLMPATARLLVKKRPPGSLEVLLHYLPYAVEENTIEEICFGLDGMAIQDGKLVAALVAALKDPFPARRGVAACIVGARGNPEQRTRVRRLWIDPDGSVRLRAAQGLLAAGDKEAIPVLIRLLEGVSTHLAWQAEELLHWAAGSAAPALTIGSGSSKACKNCRAAWEGWWQQHGMKLELVPTIQTGLEQ